MTSWISAALWALAEQDRGREAPEHVETRLLAAFRQSNSKALARKKRKMVVLGSLALAAGIALAFVAGSWERPKPIAPAPVRLQPVTVAAAPAPEPEPKPVLKARPVKRQPREVVTEFFPLLDVAPPFESGELLRVTVPAATMRKVGLPVNENRLADPVYADVLVGQEGLARAIRFVSYEQ
jgi:hypothetical protein